MNSIAVVIVTTMVAMVVHMMAMTMLTRRVPGDCTNKAISVMIHMVWRWSRS